MDCLDTLKIIGSGCTAFDSVCAAFGPGCAAFCSGGTAVGPRCTAFYHEDLVE